MRKTLPLGILIIIITLMIGACGSPSLLVPAIQDQNPVTIDTLASGSVVSSDAQIPVHLVYSDSYKQDNKSPDSMQISLLNADGTEIRSFAIGAQELSADDTFKLNLPDLPSGMYTLDLTVNQGGKVLQEKSVQFFHVKGSYSVTGISTYPSSFYPGSAGLLQAHLDIPEGADPYLRWTMNKAVIAEGLLSKGLDQVLLRAPSVEGVYNVTVELYPMAPADGSTFSFSSSIKQTTEIFVSRTQNAGEHELAPASSYYSLFHFRGDYRDDGVRVTMRNGNAPEAVAIGNPDLRISGSIFGYHLDGTSGFLVKEVILPFSNGRLSPFSLTMRAMADSDEISRSIFSAVSADGTFSFSVHTDSNGHAVATISHGGATGSVSSGEVAFPPAEPVILSVSVEPGEDSTRILWFKDGIQLNAGTVPVGFGAVPSGETKWTVIPGVSTICGPTADGKSDGFLGIIDEFGIYFRDAASRPSTDSEIFSAAMEAKYGSALVYAQGFEGAFLPNDVETHGPVAVGNGNLVLKPGGEITFPRFLFERQELVVDLSMDKKAAEEKGDLLFRQAGSAANSKPMLAVNTDGTVRIPSTALVSVKRKGMKVPLSSLQMDREKAYVLTLSDPIQDSVEIRMTHGESDLHVVIQDEQYSLHVSDTSFSGVRMSLSQDATRSVPFHVHSVLARKESGDLTSTLNSVLPSQSAAPKP